MKGLMSVDRDNSFAFKSSINKEVFGIQSAGFAALQENLRLSTSASSEAMRRLQLSMAESSERNREAFKKWNESFETINDNLRESLHKISEFTSAASKQLESLKINLPPVGFPKNAQILSESTFKKLEELSKIHFRNSPVPQPIVTETLQLVEAIESEDPTINQGNPEPLSRLIKAGKITWAILQVLLPLVFSYWMTSQFAAESTEQSERQQQEELEAIRENTASVVRVEQLLIKVLESINEIKPTPDHPEEPESAD